jgi:hypothetical protein
MGLSLTHWGSWRSASASVRGTSHLRSGLPCQDAHLVRRVATKTGREVLLVACSDGAGSASHSQVGSHVACKTVVKAAANWIEQGNSPEDVTRPIVEDWFIEVMRSIAEEAELLQLRPRELACTLLFALVGDGKAAFAQVGDGAIVASVGDEYVPIFWPQSGEYANQTYFITDQEALTRVQYDFLDGVIEEVAAFTDGIQSLALQYAAYCAHTPFFRPLFERLRRDPPGQREDLSDSLRQFLASDRVNQRTDDDKTLVLASRRSDLPAFGRPQSFPTNRPGGWHAPGTLRGSRHAGAD